MPSAKCRKLVVGNSPYAELYQFAFLFFATHFDSMLASNKKIEINIFRKKRLKDNILVYIKWKDYHTT